VFSFVCVFVCVCFRLCVLPLTAASPEMDDTQPHDGYLSTYVDNEQHHTLHAFLLPSTTAMEQCYAGKDEEIDESLQQHMLWMSQQFCRRGLQPRYRYN